MPERLKRPTDAELEILNVVWILGPCTVRDVHQEVLKKRDAGYTTILKLMQIMTEKGILKRDESVRPQIFRASRPKATTQRQIVADMVTRLFSGSPGNLVLQALSEKTTPDERQKIRELLDEIEGNEK